ncbi:MAG TPA: hypothetical protein ENK03_04130 [Candidatus Cloacimonetes bacterium]|nr:hypothetical protein [Candidatus Cloacimonadota bacterium]
MMKKIVFIILLILIPLTISAGRYAGDFILLGSGVRPLGMGGAFTAVADNGNAIYWNASGLAQITEIEAEVMHAFLFDNLAAYDFFSFCIPLPASTTIGVSFTQLSVNNIPYFDEKWLKNSNVFIRSSNVDLHLTGDPDGYFTSSDQLFEFAFAKNFSRVINLGWELFDLPIDYYVGGTFKYIKRSIHENIGTGMGGDISFMVRTDFGLLTEVPWLGKIRFAFNLQDIGGTKITWDTRSKHIDEIFTTPKFGLAVEQPLHFINSEMVVAWDWYEDYEYRNNLGLEFTYKDLLSFRTGLFDKHLTAGLGFRYNRFMINYALITHTDLGNSHRVGVMMNF